MKKSKFHSSYAALLIVALLFGQIGAAFLHNEHDAHETTIEAGFDLHQEVLLPHGEHCKVCAVDWVHQFLAASFKTTEEIRTNEFPVPRILVSLADPSLPSSLGRAPPIF